MAAATRRAARGASGGGGAGGVVEAVEGAAAAEGGLSLGLIVELHRQTDNLVPLLRKQRRGHGRIDAAGHCYDDTHNKNITTKDTNSDRTGTARNTRNPTPRFLFRDFRAVFP